MPFDRGCRSAAPVARIAVAAPARWLLLAALSLAACEDPVKSAEATALGPEAPGVVAGPLHRPGQPCLVCHDGAAAREFSLAGTVYWTPEADEPAPGTSVHFIDEASRRFVAVTNCAGNFFVQPGDFEPQFPLWVMLDDGEAEIEMDSPIHGDGSCAGCHGLTPGPQSAGRVYLNALTPEDGPGVCP